MSLTGVEDYPVDSILEAIDKMAAGKQPKVILFDVGGVCVISPFQTILDYELGLGIPPGWINFSISKSGPTGFWQRIERGDIPMDKAFFDGFNADLHKPDLWKVFYEREQAKNPELARELPPVPRIDGEWMFNEMMSASHAPDPWISPALEKLKESGKYIIAALSNTVIFPPGHKLHRPDFASDPLRSKFDVFVSSAHVRLRKPDPKMYQLAVKTLDAFARQNAATPKGQNLNWGTGVTASDILFLDDIGENLKAAKGQGYATIRVPLGKAYEAVEELEKITGLRLEGSHPKIAIKPKIRESKAKI